LLFLSFLNLTLQMSGFGCGRFNLPVSLSLPFLLFLSFLNLTLQMSGFGCGRFNLTVSLSLPYNDIYVVEEVIRVLVNFILVILILSLSCDRFQY
jgi:hypothetical protein